MIIMDRFTKALLLVIAVCLVMLCARDVVAPRSTVHGAGSDMQFSADKDRFYFYDPISQKVYAYATTGGHPQGVVELTRPGGELKPVPGY